MYISIDLHSHSGYSGGVGKMDLDTVAKSMTYKGIDMFGTGDCLHPYWSSHLESTLIEKYDGLFSLPDFPDRLFVLQTEIVLTAPPDGVKKGRKTVHVVILYPDFKSIEKTTVLFRKKGVKNTIGRPFVVNDSPEDVSNFLHELQAIDENILIFPAHVMTPEGIFGSKVPLTYMEEFFGEFTKNIKLIETGLSADPIMLDRIPECRSLNFISNSDCHSAALHRIGREFTIVDLQEMSFIALKQALTADGIVSTFEFNPREGKFFGTGHRKGKKGHDLQPYIKKTDTDLFENICPVCGKPVTVGVMDRILELENRQNLSVKGKKSRQFKHIIPLVEVIAYGMDISTYTSARVINTYHKIIEAVGSEAKLWTLSPESTEKTLSESVPKHILKAITGVQTDSFTFEPPGYDGEYGVLNIRS